jgi:hypothetical protein
MQFFTGMMKTRQSSYKTLEKYFRLKKWFSEKNGSKHIYKRRQVVNVKQITRNIETAMNLDLWKSVFHSEPQVQKCTSWQANPIFKLDVYF